MLKLYTDESPGLKVDPFVVMVLSIGFIISVVALHSEYNHDRKIPRRKDPYESEEVAPEIVVLTRETQFWPRSPRGSLRKRGKREVRRRRFKEHGVWMIFFIRDIYIQPFFSLLPLAGLASGLYHTVARSPATHSC